MAAFGGGNPFASGGNPFGGGGLKGGLGMLKKKAKPRTDTNQLLFECDSNPHCLDTNLNNDPNTTNLNS